MATFALSRFRYRRWKNNDIAFWFISQRMMPPIALVVPYFILFGRVGLLDSLPVLMAVYTAMCLPLDIWLLRDYFQDLPIEIEEASMVDGSSRYGAFFASRCRWPSRGSWWRFCSPSYSPGMSSTSASR
jgi:multiple sugar transport system permease protein